MRQLQYLRELLEPGYSAYSASEKSVIMLLILLNSLVPRPRLAFRRLQFFLSRFSILIVTESWMGPGNEATSECLWTMKCTAILSTEC